VIVVVEGPEERRVRSLTKERIGNGDHGPTERWLQEALFDAAASLPVAEVDPVAAPMVPICRELRLGTGLVDILGVSPHGRLTLIECKLWRNPESRRKVVGQILDYAANLRGYSYGDLTALVRQRLRSQSSNPLYELVQASFPALDEATFVDSVSRSLDAGQFCLIVAGDGIREETHAIADYLRPFASLAFSFGLMQIDIFRDEDRVLLHPRLAMRTQQVVRELMPQDRSSGTVAELEGSASVTAPSGSAGTQKDREFWERFINEFRPTHPEQPRPRHGGKNYVRFELPAPLRTMVGYRVKGGPPRIGVFIRFRSPEELDVYHALRAASDEILAESGVQFGWIDPEPDDPAPKAELYAYRAVPRLDDPETEPEQRAWICQTANALLNSLRPRIKQAASAARN
jgi:hypothetical protein